MNTNVASILSRNIAEGVHYSHGSMINPTGNYQLNRHVLEEFWTAYCTEIETGNYAFGIGEVSDQYIPVLVDVDLKIKEDDNPFDSNNLYTLVQVKEVINIYQQVLKEIVEDCDNDNLLCVFLKKDPYIVTSGDLRFIKNGFHLHFPNLFLNKKDQTIHLLPRVKALVKEANLFNNLGKEDSGAVLDDSYCAARWLLYGSKKSEQMEPYLISKIYNHRLEELTLEDAFTHYLIYNKNDKVISVRGNVKFYLPRILSTLVSQRVALVKEIKSGIVPSFDHLKSTKKNNQPQKIYEKISDDEAIKVAARLVPMLSVDRAVEYMDWMTIGWVLYNISNGSNDGYVLWVDFSKKCPEKFDESTCCYEWEKMSKGDMTIGTLRYYASVDSPEAYKEFKREQTMAIVDDSLSGTHNDIAKIMYSEFGNEFVCAKISPETWYRFSGHIWEYTEGGYSLRRKISEDIVMIMREKCAFLHTAQMDETSRDAKIKQYQKIIKDLKSAPFKNNVMKEACEIFYNPKFLDNLDKNPYIIAFKNCIYDLEKNIPRSGKPEDFISKSMPISYRNYLQGDEAVVNVYRFYEKLFPDQAVRDFFLDSNASIFVGKNLRKEVQMWTGDFGNNGKSVNQKLISNMLGPKFCIKMETTLITGKKPNSGGAWPELSRAGNGVRAVFFDELSDEEEIRLGMFKKLSGNDSFPARDCFEKGKDMKDYEPMFKMFIISNKLARFHKGGDQATWNRVCVIPYESVFCPPDDPAPASYEEQLLLKRFPMDKDLDSKLVEMAEPLAWILLQRRITPKILYKPPKVMEAITSYRRRNDIYRQYMDECIIEKEGALLSLIELYTSVKDWFKESLPGQRIPEKTEVKDYFIGAWSSPDRGTKWKGYKIRTLEDDIESGDVIILNGNNEVD